MVTVFMTLMADRLYIKPVCARIAFVMMVFIGRLFARHTKQGRYLRQFTDSNSISDGLPSKTLWRASLSSTIFSKFRCIAFPASFLDGLYMRRIFSAALLLIRALLRLELRINFVSLVINALLCLRNGVSMLCAILSRLFKNLRSVALVILRLVAPSLFWVFVGHTRIVTHLEYDPK